jgi:hypothetical protein
MFISPKFLIPLPAVFFSALCNKETIKKLSDDEVAKILIQQSIYSYSEPCALIILREMVQVVESVDRTPNLAVFPLVLYDQTFPPI